MSPPPVPSWLQKLTTRNTLPTSGGYSQIASAPVSESAHIADQYSISVGCSPENHLYNRYATVDAGGRYFNANWVRELAGGRWTIATQAPLPHTAHEFLSLIAGIQPPSAHPRNLVSNFARRQKAHPYFPHEPGESRIFQPPRETSLPSLKVTLIKSEVIESALCVASTVSITPIVDGKPRSTDRMGLLNFIRLVDRTNRDLDGLETAADVEPPIMAHCSAGVGRTGCFIALCSLLRSNGLLSPSNSERAPIRPAALPQSPLGPLPESINWDEVGQEIDSLREQRPGMGQGAEQAVFVYEMLMAAFLTKDGP
ncbi:protein-tyrosine phosphatase-like protein [Lactifluus volemus]|nr:protein-tyrosine phosphatase-like protein [Lactifluus volemus]